VAYPAAMPNTIVSEVAQLGADWHGAGTVTNAVLEALDRHLAALGHVAHSVETGTGRTTLIFSQHSADHLVFTHGDDKGNSLLRVRESPLCAPGVVRFELGATQRTVLSHEFSEVLDVVYLDGPHAYPFPELEYWATYPHLRTGGLLIIDDLQMPTIANMWSFLKADAMYEVVDVVDNTGFLRRTSAPTLDPYGDGWQQQGYNRSMRFGHLKPSERAIAMAKHAIPRRLKNVIKSHRL
jgi:hypothetical protein